MRSGGPLRGKRVLVTRARDQAGELIAALESNGAEPLHCPMIETVALSDQGPLVRALQCAAEYDWLLFTSANAVRYVSRAVALRELLGPRVAAIGPATAAALRAHGLLVHLQPREHVAEALLEALGDVTGLRFLFPRAARARETLPDGLRARGGIVDVVTAYVTRAPPGAGESLRRVFNSGPVDAALFTSASGVQNAVTLLGGADAAAALLGEARLVFLGPVAAEAARRLKLRVDEVAERYTSEGLLEALVRTF